MRKKKKIKIKTINIDILTFICFHNSLYSLKSLVILGSFFKKIIQKVKKFNTFYVE